MATWPAMEEREKERWKCVEFCGNKEFWKIGKALTCGGRKGIRKRKKELIREDIFSWTPKMKLSKRLITGFKSGIRKTFRKIPKSSEIQVSRNDSQILPKINNIILGSIVKSVLRNTL